MRIGSLPILRFGFGVGVVLACSGIALAADGPRHVNTAPAAAMRPSPPASATPFVPLGPRQAPVSFNNEIEPILTRYGCNQGTCHGAQYGKGGFKLSLAAFDPDLDFSNIVKQSKGRRISLADPARSLILRKPGLFVPHGGGRRLEAGSADFNRIEEWIAEGAHGPDAADPIVTRIDASPGERILPALGEKMRLTVRATYSDGSVRDVTRWTRLNSLNDAIAQCTPAGLVTAAGKGQTAIMARFSGQAAVSTILVPYGPLTPAETSLSARTRPPAARTIDALVERKQRQLGLSPSPICDDATFIRRVGFDLIGTAPTPDEIRRFEADRTPDKRARLVDSLLARPEYADFWTLKWGDLLRSNRANLTPKGMWSFTNWIHTQLQSDRPVNQWVHDLLLGQGSTFTNGPANYYRVAGNPQDLAETTSQVFLGVRLQCARCHHHPFEKWSQTDYYRFAAFFARVGQKGSQDFGLFGNETIVKIQDGGEVYHPKTGAKMQPAPLGVVLASAPAGSKAQDPDAGGDRRLALADWLTSSDNRLFARNIANRYWGYMFGKGIVNPIDDERVTNPPTNPELLDYLADELTRGGYDLEHLLRLICTSNTYQRSSSPTRANVKDELFFTHYYMKQLPAETLLDAIDYACGTHEKFNDLPPGTRAIQLPDPVPSDFLDTFGRPQRVIACECERYSEPNLSQTLRLMNSPMLNSKISAGKGRIATLVAQNKSDNAILTDLYMATLGRTPRASERTIVLGVLAFSSERDRRPIFEDVLLTLLNSKEFLLNH
ncbi:MAG TPA: DUF1549 and DUF1553 domain-containing protein [Chthonomonadaceae bacterium]|nr:DUF1549 and DUF1553 domain-containing protein [Chthonomonadaceae bacterium]